MVEYFGEVWGIEVTIGFNSAHAHLWYKGKNYSFRSTKTPLLLKFTTVHRIHIQTSKSILFLWFIKQPKPQINRLIIKALSWPLAKAKVEDAGDECGWEDKIWDNSSNKCIMIFLIYIRDISNISNWWVSNLSRPTSTPSPIWTRNSLINNPSLASTKKLRSWMLSYPRSTSNWLMKFISTPWWISR